MLSSKHTHSSASLVAIGRWLTRATLLISNISVQNLDLGQCQAMRKVQDCIGHAHAWNCRLFLWVFVCWSDSLSSIHNSKDRRFLLHEYMGEPLPQFSEIKEISYSFHHCYLPLRKRGNLISIVCLSISWVAQTVVDKLAWNFLGRCTLVQWTIDILATIWI